jgi:hypothetical protein
MLNEADVIFRFNAAELGYLAEDPHEPGFGRGIHAYYYDNGLVPPSRWRRIAEMEFNGQDWEDGPDGGD